MMFRTELHLAPAATQFNLAANVVTVGSCFSEVIGRQLEKYQVNTLTNPFGTIFNPLSACKLLQICAGADVELADSFVENNGRWFSYDFHSSFSAPTEEELYEQLDEAIVKTRRFLKKADLLIITLGTANIFRLNISGETVANCHKLPSSLFTKETLLPEEIISALAETHSLLRELNPKLRIILSVSPVRHLKDTLELNSVSKAVLRLATHYLAEQVQDLTYFPAYELLLDDLRDYRFYKDDMLHPTGLAENYIWEKFSKVYFDQSFHSFSADWDSVLRGMAHRPFHPESAAHQAFVQQMLEKLRSLQSHTDVTSQLAYFESQVIIPPVLEEPEEETDEEVTEETEAVLAQEAGTETASSPNAALARAAETGAEQAENGIRKKKKKNRKKKKRSPEQEAAFAAARIVEAGETGSVQEGAASTAPEPDQTISEAETAQQASGPGADRLAEQTPAQSKAAKKRANRRKKKAFSDREESAPAEIAAADAPFTGTSRTLESEYGFATDTETQETASPATQAPAPDTSNAQTAEAKTDSAGIPAAASSRPIKPARQRPERKPKTQDAEVMPVAAAPVTSESQTAETSPETKPASQPAETKPETTPAGQAAEPAKTLGGTAEKLPEISRPKEKPAPKRTAKGKKPKMPQLFTEAPQEVPVTETIAVPFVPAQEISDNTPATASSENPVTTKTKETAEAKVNQKAPEVPVKKKRAARTTDKAKAPAKPKPESTAKKPVKPRKPAKVTKPEAAAAQPKEPEIASVEASVETTLVPAKKQKPAAKKTASKAAPAVTKPEKAEKAKQPAKTAAAAKPKAPRAPRKKKDSPES